MNVTKMNMLMKIMNANNVSQIVFNA